MSDLTTLGILPNPERDERIILDKELRKISSKIYVAQLKGEKTCKIQGSISENATREIRKYGYNTERAYGCVNTTVSWN